MYILEKIKKQIADDVNRAMGQDLVKASDLVYPPHYAKASSGKPNPDMGDLSLPCFTIAKEMKKNPAEVAGDLVKKIGANDIIAGTKAVGPYFNIILNKTKLAGAVLGEIGKQKNKYGSNDSGAKKRVMVEYSNANTHKEYHVGHLRNLCYGDSVNRLLAANGYKSIPVSYINDFGIHVAKTLWAYLEFYKDASLPDNKGRFLGQVYVRSSQEMAKNKTAKGMVELMMKKIESRCGEEYKLWQKTRKWTIEQFAGIYKELEIKFDHTFYESEVIDQGLIDVDRMLAKGILEVSQGAVIANLEKYNLGVLMFKRSDGTALYPVADLALAEIKFKKYKLDTSIYVVDVRQGLHFKQLFKVLELMGYKQDMVHLGYDVVKLPSGMMSSREGNVITYEDLREQLFNKAKEETASRHQDWNNAKIRRTADAITNGAIKFEMIKVDANQIITFDIDKALSFNGFTAAYLQYTCARINSVIRKSKTKPQNAKNKSAFALREELENVLIIKLAKYPEIVRQAGEKYDPSEVAKYLFELAQIFNDYYHKVQILKAEEDIKNARLSLIAGVSQLIQNGLELLGIKTVSEM